MTKKHEADCECVMCNGQSMAEFNSNTEALIAKFGWTVLGIFAGEDPKTDPPFCYSVGLLDCDHPEILIMGLEQQLGQRLINDIGRHIKDGLKFEAGTTSDLILKGMPVKFVFPNQVKCEHKYTTVSARRAEAYDQQFKVIQMLWPDTQGRFPGDEGYETRFVQPLI